MTEKQRNIASIRARLANISKTTGEDFQQLLTRYANERFLYRLSISSHSNHFLLKGASLFTLWFNSPHRSTRDIDFLAFGSNNIQDLEKIIDEICTISYDDGLEFDRESIKGNQIKEGQEYQGVRITFLARLGNARVHLQIDVGFGDAVTPGPISDTFPTLLDSAAPVLRVYPKETVVAEKFEAMVKLGIANSRMKDFWDLDLLIREFRFDGKILQKAIESTFERRHTDLPTEFPLALTEEFFGDRDKKIQWQAFIKRNNLGGEIILEEIVFLLRPFFLPLLECFRKGTEIELNWNPMQWEV